ncbi:MAG: KH domain-containing protein [Erysipelotrichaceae bacterium]|nr:KH domain-containing protein [Erysipelotrichaceae bacterium]
MNNYTGKTLEELLAAAAEEKGVAVEELTYFVTEEKKGLLGIGSSVSADVYCMDDVKEFLFDYIGNFFTGIDQDIEVGIEEKDNGFIVRLNAENNAVLIGKMGKTLASLNTVVRGAVNNEFRKRIDVLVDVNDYKEDRYSRLRSIARKTAKQVQRTHVDAELDPMPNDERKIIHKYLNNWHNIRTESEGEGSARHLCIKYVPDEETAEEAE